jgi:membrane-associated phospholipid phosphatase
MCSSLLIGFIVYYFFPTTAPASVLHSDYFIKEQLATGLKFTQIHQYIQPTTLDGGLIAFPSFHVIWAWLCLYLIRSWFVVFYVFLFINILLIFSCVMLGWHYFLDIILSFLILLFCHYLLALTINRTASGARQE